MCIRLLHYNYWNLLEVKISSIGDPEKSFGQESSQKLKEINCKHISINSRWISSQFFSQQNNRFWVVPFLIYHDESFYPISNLKGFTSLHSILEGFTLGSWRTEIDSFQGIKRAPRYAQKPYVFHPGKFAASLVVERIRWPRSKRPTSVRIYVKYLYRYSMSSINRISICRHRFYCKITGAISDFRVLPFLFNCYLYKLH